MAPTKTLRSPSYILNVQSLNANDKEIPKEKYTNPEKRQEIIDDL